MVNTFSRLPRPSRSPWLVLPLAITPGLVSLAHAQTTPDAGSLLRQVEPARVAPPPPPAPARTAPPPLLHLPGEATVQVARFDIAGHTLLDTARLQAAVAGYLNRPLNFAELQRAAGAVADAYRDAGWVVRTYLPQQDVTSGRVTIQVVEAVFGQVRIEGQAERVREAQLRRIVATAQAPGQPVNGPALDRALLLIDDLPGISARGSLSEGQREAETDLLLQVSDNPLLVGDASVDNTGSRSTGSARLAVNLTLNSPTARADQAQAMLIRTEGSDYARLSYTLPLGAGGWRLGANASWLNYRLLTAEFAAVAAQGNSSTAGLDATYPLLRSRTANASVALSLEGKRFDNQSGGVTATRYATRTATASLSAHRYDELGQGGSTAGNLALTLGRVNLDGSPNQAADAAGPRTAGGFGRLRYALTRQQVIDERWQLFAALNGQTASKNLDSSEKFYLGGAGGVRAYPASEGGGSEGQILTVEARARWTSTLLLSAFIDHGRVRVNRNNDIAGAARLNSFSLQGAGLAAQWTGPRGLTLKATLAQRIGSNPNATATGNDQDGTRIRQRLWLHASLPF